jgi:hypothetical protein
MNWARRLKVIAGIEEPELIERILAHRRMVRRRHIPRAAAFEPYVTRRCCQRRRAVQNTYPHPHSTLLAHDCGGYRSRLNA